MSDTPKQLAEASAALQDWNPRRVSPLSVVFAPGPGERIRKKAGGTRVPVPAGQGSTERQRHPDEEAFDALLRVRPSRQMILERQAGMTASPRGSCAPPRDPAVKKIDKALGVASHVADEHPEFVVVDA